MCWSMKAGDLVRDIEEDRLGVVSLPWGCLGVVEVDFGNGESEGMHVSQLELCKKEEK